jgi:hypothetical protein
MRCWAENRELELRRRIDRGKGRSSDAVHRNRKDLYSAARENRTRRRQQRQRRTGQKYLGNFSDLRFGKRRWIFGRFGG